MAEYGTDALRFYLMRDVAFGSDGSVGMDGVRSRYEAELANEYGNLASRTAAMVGRYRDGDVPAGETDRTLGADFDRLDEAVAELMNRAEPTQALELIWQRVRRLNRYVEERAPWQLAREPANAEALDQTLRSLFEGIRVVSLLLHPYMPTTTDQLLRTMGFQDRDYSLAPWNERIGGMFGPLEPLFPKR
jgi:methionyl-tRNA synthetase